MDIEEYISLLKEKADSFKEYWKNQRETYPESFPKKLELADWEEQFSFYIKNSEEV